MTNAEKFKQLFGIYATELWAMPEEKFLEWLNAETGQDWIPVTERLPEIHKDVLVRDREVSDVYVSYYCGGGYWNTDTDGANNRIIAWRPLPEAYMEEEA